MSRAGAGIYKRDMVTEEEELIYELFDEAYVGKAENNDIRLEDIRCDGIHALIERNPETKQYHLVDLGSHFGTYIDGLKIEEIPLEMGEEFVIGNQHLIIRNSDIETTLITDQKKERERKYWLRKKTDKRKKKNKSATKELLTEKSTLQISHFWGQQILDVRTFTEGADITLGTSRGATFTMTFNNLNISETELFTIAKYTKNQLFLNVPAEATGLIWIGNETFSLDALRHKDKTSEKFGDLKLTLRIGDRADIQFGELVLSFRFVSPPEKPPVQFIPRVDKNVLKILSFILAMYFLLVVFLLTGNHKPPEKTLKDIPEHLKKVIYDAGIKEALKRQQAAIGELKNKLSGRARSEEGKSSAKKDKKKLQQKRRVVKKKVNRSKSNRKRSKVAQRQAKKAQEAAPVLDLDAAFSSDSKATDLSKNVQVLGETTEGNTAAAISSGGFARGRKGLGAGGGGKSVGIGALKGNESGGGLGAGDYGLEPSKGREIDVPLQEEVVILGGLDPEIIAAVIRRNIQRIRYCYEQQLTIYPDLKGKVKVSFVIGGKGSVTQAKVAETSLYNTDAEGCILKVMKSLKFPKPLGGGSVGVKYPFIFTSQGG